jgi:hypothetical protein
MNTQQFIRNGLVIGAVSSLTSTLAVLAGGKRTVGKAAPPMNAVSHIAWGGRPPANPGRGAINMWTGAALHTGACIFWSSIFDLVFRRRRPRSSKQLALGAVQTAALAYVTDYYVVSKRFRPGYEAYLSPASMFAVYAALAAGIALGAALTGSTTKKNGLHLPNAAMLGGGELQ